MKRTIRKSQYNDYIAVDISKNDKPDVIVETPFYVTPSEPENVLMKDDETGKWVKTVISMDKQGNLKYECADGFSDSLPVDELAMFHIRFPKQTISY